MLCLSKSLYNPPVFPQAIKLSEYENSRSTWLYTATAGDLVGSPAVSSPWQPLPHTVSPDISTSACAWLLIFPPVESLLTHAMLLGSGAQRERPPTADSSDWIVCCLEARSGNVLASFELYQQWPSSDHRPCMMRSCREQVKSWTNL